MLCILKSCGKCGGDLVLDESDWKCMQCAKYYLGDSVSPSEGTYSLHPSVTPGQPVRPEPDFILNRQASDQTDSHESPQRRFRNRRRSRSTRSINSLVNATHVSDARWWARNRQVIEYLEQGLPIREISELTDRDQRQIRTIRERLTDLRVAAGEAD